MCTLVEEALRPPLARPIEENTGIIIVPFVVSPVTQGLCSEQQWLSHGPVAVEGRAEAPKTLPVIASLNKPLIFAPFCCDWDS